MKKFGILCLALVIALGALGVGYAAWTDTIFIDGTVSTGSVCLNIERFKEYGGCPDEVWGNWVYDGVSVSCPMGYHFEGIVEAPEGKCPATVSFLGVDTDADGKYDELEVTIDNAYPYFAADISFWVCNCGTIPLKIEAPVINQSNWLLIEYGDNIGRQLHPGQCAEISFYVGVTQHEGYESAASGLWIVDDITKPICPQNTPLSFTIDIMGTQWNEYPYTPAP
jgi:hypothetical protein